MSEETAIPVETKEEVPQTQTWVDKYLSYDVLLIAFFLMNLLTYLERVVLSGSSEKILEFVRREFPDDEHTYFGALSSAFILGYSVTSVIFAYWVTKAPPFKVVSVGLSCWILASLMSGLAPNYLILLIARIISGVGEASFHIVIPAYINEVSPKKKLGTSLALLYAGTPIGTAIGFILSGWVSQNYSWRYMYLVLSPLMLPGVIIAYFITYIPKRNEDEKTSFFRATITLLKMPTYIFACLAAAGGVYLCGAYLAFGNQLLMHLGFFDNEAISSLVFGVVCCCAGIIGSLLGGWALNHFGVKDTDTHAASMWLFSKHLLVCGLTCVSFCGITALCVKSKVLFLLFFFFGFTGVFMSNPSWTLIVLNTAPPLVRPMALAASILINHLLGDVPGPIFTGRFLDICLRWAGEDTHRRWLAYVYTHWFILLSLLVILISAINVCIITKRKLMKEQKSLISSEQTSEEIRV